MTIRGPLCQMCNVNELIFIGYMNAKQVYYCPYCDRPHERQERSAWRF